MKLKGALIGFGKIAQTAHLQAYQSEQLKSMVEIIAAAEPNDENRKLSKEKFPSIKFYSSTKELLKNERLDFIDITTPPKYHSELIMEGVENNLHIICEKPFTFNFAEAELISKILKQSNLVFMSCHQYRFSPLWMNFKEAIDLDKSNSKALLQFNVYRDKADLGLPVFNSPWRIDKKLSGGGILADTGIHYLYLSNWMLGKPIQAATKLFTLNHTDYGVEDTSLTIIEFEKGVAEITLTWAADKRDNSARLTLPGKSLIYNGGDSLIKNINGKTEIVKVADVSEKSHYSSLYSVLFSSFINKINNGENSFDEIDEASQSIKLLESCYESAETGRTVFL
jgi:predicted dehydrogenase